MDSILILLLSIQLLAYIMFYIFYRNWGLRGFLISIPLTIVLQISCLFISRQLHFTIGGDTAKSTFNNIMADIILPQVFGFIMAFMFAIISMFIVKEHKVVAFLSVPLAGLFTFYISLVIFDNLAKNK